MEGAETTQPGSSSRPDFDMLDEQTGHIDHVASSGRDEGGEVEQVSESQRDEDANDDRLTAEESAEEPCRVAEESEIDSARRNVLVHEQELGHYDDSGGEIAKHIKGPKLPNVNCPEKIIICVDLASEVNKVPFMQRDGTKHLPIELVKRALSIFVRTKSAMNPLHQFALVILQETAVWLQDFTSDVEEFLNVMFDLTNETQDCDLCDITSLFETIQSKVELPLIEDVEVLPPPFVVRTLFFYGRSSQIPRFSNGKEVQLALSSSPYFFFDVFYLHEPPSEDNYCKDIYDVFLDLDVNNTSYIHEVGRNTTQLYNKMAAMVAHPLQRPEQVWCSYSLDAEQ